MIDKPEQNLYTEDVLMKVAELAAQRAIDQLIHAPPNLDNRTIKEDRCSSVQEGASNMPSTYRETYSYVDEHGVSQSIRFNGKNKKETDAKFQDFLCGPKTKKEVPTLKAYVDTVYRKSFIDGLAATTKSNYERYLKSYILPFMGEMEMDKITLATIQGFYDWLAHRKSYGFQQDINEKSISRIGGLLSRILSIAAEMKVIDESPFKAKLLKNNGAPAGHHRALPDEEVARVKKTIPILPTEQQRLYMGFLCYTGLRREEILGLDWGNINMQDRYGTVGCVVVYPDNNHPIVKLDPKTEHSRRDFIIPQPLYEILEQVQDRTGFVIHGEDSAVPMPMSSFAKMYRKAFSILGIQNYNNHDWRTTLATQLKESGMTSAQVADIMGHADTRMVETVYARARHEGIMKHKNAIETLNQSFARGTGEAPKTAV